MNHRLITMHLWHLSFTPILIIEMTRYWSKIVTAFINCKDLFKLNLKKNQPQRSYICRCRWQWHRAHRTHHYRAPSNSTAMGQMIRFKIWWWAPNGKRRRWRWPWWQVCFVCRVVCLHLLRIWVLKLRGLINQLDSWVTSVTFKVASPP